MRGISHLVSQAWSDVQNQTSIQQMQYQLLTPTQVSAETGERVRDAVFPSAYSPLNRGAANVFALGMNDIVMRLAARKE